MANEEEGHRYWVFAATRDAARRYFVVGGYYIRYARAGTSFPLDTLGSLFYLEAGHCTAIGPAREVFDVRPFDEIDQSTLRLLAADLVQRYVRAFGSTAGLRAELRNQRVDIAAMPLELREAFKPFAAP